MLAERPQEETAPTPLRVALIGEAGVGKTTVARCIDTMPVAAYNGEAIHSIRMRQLLQWQGYTGEDSFADMQGFHQRERDAGRGDAILDPLTDISHQTIVVDALRHVIDIIRFIRRVEDGGLGGYLIDLKAPHEVCKERFAQDRSDEKHAVPLGTSPLSPEEEAKRRGKQWDAENAEVSDTLTTVRDPLFLQSHELVGQRKLTVVRADSTIGDVAERVLHVIEGLAVYHRNTTADGTVSDFVETAS